MGLVEGCLDRMEEILSEVPKNGAASTVEDTPSPEERSCLLDNIGGLRKKIQGFAEEFSLQRHPVTSARC